MKYLPIINLENINCWIITLIPYSKDKRDDKEILDFQLNCIDKKIFGIGWKNFPDNDAQFSRARDNFKSIKKGDFIMMRLKNSHYYIGKVKTPPYLNKSSDILTWCGNVEKWIDFENEEMLPSEIVGRMSQRYHPTVQQVCNIRQKLLIIKIFEDSVCEKERIVPSDFKIYLSENNFTRCLTYTELEDLVYRYILFLHKNDGYYLLPSSCKTSHQKYEFTLVNDNPEKKPITCQVKNQEKIDIGKYCTNTLFHKIYLFSSLGYENVEKLDNSFIEIINPDKLFETLKNFKYLNLKMKNYYSIDKSQTVLSDFKCDGWIERKVFKGDSGKRLKINYDEDSIKFALNEIVYYTEIKSLVLLKDKNDIPNKLLQMVKEHILKVID